MDATNWRTKLAIRYGVILRKVWAANGPERARGRKRN
jgi:hypothetical protein